MKVVIIGTGNTAYILSKKILAAGHDILQVIGRNVEKADDLASQLQTVSAYNVRDLEVYADIYIIAVSDAAISSVASNINLHDKVLVHTSAAVSKNVLNNCSTSFGVLYPLQSLVKNIDILPSIPVLVDGNTATTIETLKEFCAGWAETVQVANDEDRLKLHVAAVFVNNFSNYLFTIAQQYCLEENLQFSLLHPLIEETVKRLQWHSPAAMQTGPAFRKDYNTIEKHLQILKNYPEMDHLYYFLSNSIISFYDKNNTLNNNKNSD